MERAQDMCWIFSSKFEKASVILEDVLATKARIPVLVLSIHKNKNNTVIIPYHFSPYCRKILSILQGDYAVDV